MRAWRDVHVETLVPVGVQRLLDDARGARLLAIDRGHGEGIREACRACVSAVSVLGTQGQVRTEDIALVEAIGGNDCRLLALTCSQESTAPAQERMVGGRTGDAQVGLAGSVHDDAQADSGCSSCMEAIAGAALRARRVSSPLSGQAD